jgi:DNA/RNA endonuclease YhcR with UshA esterase domain
MRILPVVLLLTAACAARSSGEPHPGPSTIAEARGRALSTPVTVEGVVTVAAGSLDAGFAIQDPTGGVYVNHDSTERYLLGRHVRVTGRLMENHGLLGIAPDSVVVVDRRRVPEPRPVRTGEVGEATEGWLIVTEGAVSGEVVDDRPYGWKLYVDDGSGPLLVFVSTSAGIDVGGVRAGQRLRVVGLSGQYDDHHEVLPRAQADVVVLR